MFSVFGTCKKLFYYFKWLTIISSVELLQKFEYQNVQDEIIIFK